MNGWQVDSMWEAETAELWERLNAPDPDEALLKQAAKDMDVAIGHLDTAINNLYDASAELSETPMQDVAESFIIQIEDIKCDLRRIQETYGKGRRE